MNDTNVRSELGAVQAPPCYGTAYEFAFIFDTALRQSKKRDQVPMTFVTAEPYIGHLGLDGVGDTKSLLESALRDRHGQSATFYENLVLDVLGIKKLKAIHLEAAE